MSTELQQRAWLAYLSQELTAPAEALGLASLELEALCDEKVDEYTIKTVQRIRERSEYLLITIRRLAAQELQIDNETERKNLRHDLRAAAGYIVSATEDLSEGHVSQPMHAALKAVSHAARKLLNVIGSLTQFQQNATADSETAALIRQTLANLPAAITTAAATADRAEPAQILLIDDNEYNRDLVAKMLQSFGHTVESVSGGRIAMQRVMDEHAAPLDLILCDLLMPEVTGIDFLKWLKTHPTYWPIPVIMVSALGDDDGVLACISAGAEDYLTRPVRTELLRARIAGCLEKKRLRDREQLYQARIDRLVQAMFPPAAVDEWRQHGAIKPRRFEKVGVLFTDIAGFTAWCESRRDHPEEVVETLQDLITRFEQSAQRHGVQKIKTIGDAFMAVAGLSGTEPNPALALLKCGLDLIHDAKEHKANWNVRVGIHVGPVVTGVLGETQFSFDVWGHTVNAAARMESNGQTGRVTMSEDASADLEGLAVFAKREVSAKGLGSVTVFDFVSFVNPEPA